MLLEASTLQNQKYKSLYRQLSLRFHPDNKKTGDLKLMSELNNSAEEGDYEFRKFLDKLVSKGIIEKISGTPNEKTAYEKKEDPIDKKLNILMETSTFDSLLKHYASLIGAEQKIKIEVRTYFMDGSPIFRIQMTTQKMFSKKNKLYKYTGFEQEIRKGDFDMKRKAEALINMLVASFKEEI